MLKELKDRFPVWCAEEIGREFDLLGTDDLDSWASICLQRQLFGREINYFVDTNGNKANYQEAYRVQQSDKTLVCCDFAVDGGDFRTWDNHVVLLSNNDIENKNKLSANINSIDNITRDSYSNKACLSTLIQMMSYYGIKINNWTDEQRLILGYLDGTMIPFQVQKIDFRPVARKWLHLLDYDELAEFMEYTVNRNGFDEFNAVKDKYKLDAKIRIGKEGKLQTDIRLDELSEVFGIDMRLPKDLVFEKFEKYDKYTRNLRYRPIRNKEDLCPEGYRFFNFVITNKNFAVYSLAENKLCKKELAA
ncbi:hypothetical protein [Clostridium sp. DJ247]|uniref:hypothetical protein n=1 Tax=Clostridium sp. DJ247 TaxID=2726188 RepID=UPI00162A99E4|nr:hypothetical protein [Clostridium sp. DJ247]MBC2580840.1 hypothetical protein [Clostridium sp. DJ247]